MGCYICEVLALTRDIHNQQAVVEAPTGAILFTIVPQARGPSDNASLPRSIWRQSYVVNEYNWLCPPRACQ